MKDDMWTYYWDQVWEIDIGRWDEDYKIYAINSKTVSTNWVIKLIVSNQIFIVTKNIPLELRSQEITKLTFFEFLKSHDELDYHVWFSRNHQHLVGQLLDVLVYNLRQGNKIGSVGLLDEQVFKQQLDLDAKFIKNELQKRK